MSLDHTCIYCQGSLYHLSDGRVKCSTCKKKYSQKRVKKITTLIACFSQNYNASQSAKKLNINYITVHKHYQQFRSLAAQHCEARYQEHRNNVSEYEEYNYLERSKRHRPESVFDAHNFLTFDYGGQVYNILMPSLQQYKEQFIEDQLESLYYKEFSKFMRQSKIIKISARHNTITAFWDYFESFITQYKGVSDSYFAYYLKEAEFKFNHQIDAQQSILKTLYFKEF